MLRRKVALTPPSGVVTAMFTDIISSTELKARIEGDTSARRDARFRAEIKKPHDAVVLTYISDAGGYVVNPTGDGYCVTFVDAEEGVLCALRIQAHLRAAPITTPLGPLQVRIGIHTGMAGPTGGDYAAVTLDKAARVMSQAESGEVLVSHQTHALAAGKIQAVRFEKAGTFALKGLPPEDLYRAVPISPLPPAPGATVRRIHRDHRTLVWATLAGGLGLLALLLSVGLGRWFAPDPALPLNSSWYGSFHFLPPHSAYAGSVHLTVTKRRGDTFQGVYGTEDDQYEWQAVGSVEGNKIEWTLTQALTDAASQDIVGKAHVTGTLSGEAIRGLYQETGRPTETAELTLRRRK